MTPQEEAQPRPDRQPEVDELLTAFLHSHSAADVDAREAFCSAHPEFTDLLRLAFQELARVRQVTPGSASHQSGSAIIERLTERRAASDRYEERGEIDHGGMGLVSRVWDPELQRTLAMKTLLGHPRSSQDSHWRKKLARFLEEAQITSQLDHPGVVPVHELGIDASGRIFFTMKLVRGETLSAIFRRCWAGEELWTRTRIVTLLVKACEALAYAHAKGVLHRDLKPANVMVGRFGEVYVMDWGLARVGTPTAEDSSSAREETLEIHSHRSEGSEGSIRTSQGDVFGTVPYMPPEQARGQIDLMGPRSDVYAVGAMIYALLAGHAPYVNNGERDAHGLLLERVRLGPPTPLTECAPSAPPELVAICDKAMARDIPARYASCGELVSDLRAYIEGHVVKAYRVGPLIELRKWVARNRATAAAGTLAVFVAVVGAVLVALSEGRRARIARESEQHVQELLDERLASDLVTQADELWPVHPSTGDAMRAWLNEARTLVARGGPVAAEVAALRSAALPFPPDDPALDLEEALASELAVLRRRHEAMTELLARYRHELAESVLAGAEFEHAAATVEVIGPELEVLEGRIAAIELRARLQRPRRFAEPSNQSRHDTLASFANNLERLAVGDWGAIALVEQRLAAAASLAERSIGEYLEPWDAAIDSIGDPERCPAYGGLRIGPQLGLVPLRRDPHSGLWEFWLLLSGEAPAIGSEGALEVRAETALVFVLIPGGEFVLGAQALDSSAERFDPAARTAEGPPRTAELEPYFISKYELTQAQWQRLTGSAPSEYYVGYHRAGGPRVGPTNPVEHVSWEECQQYLPRWNLSLPTEAQWERAARGGTETRYWVGRDFEQAPAFANSREGVDLNKNSPGMDGNILHAPVNALRPNPYGLYHALGNVAEWCRDWHAWKLDEGAMCKGTGELLPEVPSAKSYRGGSFSDSALDLRVTARLKHRVDFKSESIGVRPLVPLANQGELK